MPDDISDRLRNLAASMDREAAVPPELVELAKEAEKLLLDFEKKAEALKKKAEKAKDKVPDENRDKYLMDSLIKNINELTGGSFRTNKGMFGLWAKGKR